MISTLIIILIVVLFLILGIRRGAAATLLNFAAMIANAIVSHFLGAALAQAMYDAFFKARVIESLETTISQKGAEFAAQNSMQALPGGIRGILEFFARIFGVTAQDLQGRLMLSSNQTEAIARTIEKPLQELAVFFLSILLSVVIFALLWIILKLLIRVALRVFRLPVIRQIDMVLGIVFGLLEGLVFACIIANVVYLLLSFTNPVVLDSGTLFGSFFRALVIFQ